jgi:WbqC-like protein family
VTVVVASQPMFLPWLGLFEQVRLADVFVHYDDVKLPQGASFSRRVQAKTADGLRWLTVPVHHGGSRLIKDVRIDESGDWRATHLATLEQAYTRAPYVEEMLRIAKEVFAVDTDRLAELDIASVEAIAGFFELETRFVLSSTLGTTTHSSQKLIDTVQAVGGDTYITGHGALKYLDHEAFEQAGIGVEYMDYRREPYPQLHGQFTASVTALDCIANCGALGAELVCSPSIEWKEFLTRDGS